MELIISIIVIFVVIGMAKAYLQQYVIGRIVLHMRNILLGVVFSVIGMLTGKQIQSGGGGSYFQGFSNFWKSLFSGLGGAKDITAMLKDCPFSQGQTCLSDKGIQTLLGWTAEGQPVYFQLSDDPPHAFLGGKSGSGKSNLVHVLIHGLLNNYSPSELELYILDCKEGTEFNVYAVNPVPQIKLVTLDSNVEYGLSVLEYLNEEIKRRGTEFRSAGVTKIQEYKERGKQMPRIFLIIDEFQKLLEGRRDVAEKVTREFTNLFKQGRSFGVHVMLATQSLMGLGEFIHPFRTQLGCRIALSCSEDDSRQILSDSNLEAVKLIPKKEAIINNQNGQPSENCKFVVPYAVPAVCTQHLHEVCTQLQGMGYPVDTKVFDGANLPKLEPSSFNAPAGKILLGEELNFEAQPFVFQWERRQGNNLCVAGINDNLRKGILYSVLLSIKRNSLFDRVVYFNSNPNVATPKFSSFPFVETKTPTWNCDITDVVNKINSKRTLLIIDSIDDADAFLPQMQYGAPTIVPGTPAELLKKFMDNGPRQGSYVLAFIENWRRFSRNCSVYVDNFELRLGFCLNEDDAGNLATGGYGERMNGVQDPTKAFFANRQRSTITMFRPFVVS
jgi:energy-coupling factor transporter ATP-binding protein EcfA2